MTATNDVTGDPIKTKVTTEEYRDNWERIYGTPPASDTPTVVSKTEDESKQSKV